VWLVRQISAAHAAVDAAKANIVDPELSTARAMVVANTPLTARRAA
jgi:hypothetical protein